MHSTELSVDEERERLALRFLEIGYVLTGTGRGSNGNDAISPQQYERLLDEAERIAQRLHALDRLDAAAQNTRIRTTERPLKRGGARRCD